MAVTRLLLSLLFVVTAAMAHAGSARMQLDMGSGLVAEAEYWPGAAEKPAVLILHGFLQTREFPTVRRLAESLADEGYSVLTPSLTLGVSHRRQSLACEAIHTHSMQQDVAELHAWTDWLARRAGKPPVVIGHSTGGIQLAALLDMVDSPPIDHALLISLTYFADFSGGASAAEIAVRAQSYLAVSRADELDSFALGYCRDYVTTAGNLMSYLSWDGERVSRALRDSPVPVTVIFGDRDDRIDRRWLDALRGSAVRLRPVKGANHFFDLAHEFDLLDEVVRVISGVNHG